MMCIKILVVALLRLLKGDACCNWLTTPVNWPWFRSAIYLQPITKIDVVVVDACSKCLEVTHTINHHSRSHIWVSTVPASSTYCKIIIFSYSFLLLRTSSGFMVTLLQGEWMLPTCDINWIDSNICIVSFKLYILQNILEIVILSGLPASDAHGWKSSTHYYDPV